MALTPPSASHPLFLLAFAYPGWYRFIVIIAPLGFASASHRTARSASGRAAAFLIVGLGVLTLAPQIHAKMLAYVTNNSQDGFVKVIDVTANAPITTISLGEQYFGASYIAIAPSGRLAYVLQDEVLAVIDTVTNTEGGRIPVNGSRLAFTPDGAFAYVAGCGSAGVCVVNTATRTIDAVIPASSGAAGIAISPDGHRALVVGTNLTVINTATNSGSTAGGSPGGCAISFSPDGEVAYLAQPANDSDIETPGQVAVMDTSTFTVTHTIPVGAGPADLAVTPNGRFVYVTNHFSAIPIQGNPVSTVSVIDTAIDAVVATISLADVTEPLGIAITPDGTRAYVAELEGGVAVIDTATNTVVTGVEIGDGPNFVAVAEVPTAPEARSTEAGGCSIAPQTRARRVRTLALLIPLVVVSWCRWKAACRLPSKSTTRCRLSRGLQPGTGANSAIGSNWATMRSRGHPVRVASCARPA